MCFYIGIEDLAANALIVALTKLERNYVTYRELEDYGTKVIKLLNSKGEKAVLLLSRDNTNAMFRNYSDFFVETEDGHAVALAEGKRVKDLIYQFRGYLALDVLKAFVDKSAIMALEGLAVG